MILPLIDGNGQTQLVVIDRSTKLAREVLTSYFENGTVPVLTPPALPFEPIIEPVVAPLPIIAPVPEVVVPAPIPFVAPVVPIPEVVAPVPFVAPVPIVAPVVPLEADSQPVETSKKHKHTHHKRNIGHVLKTAADNLHKGAENVADKVTDTTKQLKKDTHRIVNHVEKEVKKAHEEIQEKVQEHMKVETLAQTQNKVPSAQLTNEVLLGLDKIKANSVNLAAQLKNTIELHAHEVAQPMLEGLFDIAKTSAKIANHMKGF